VPTRISDLHIALEEPLPAPDELHAELRAEEAEAAHIASSRRFVQEIVRGSDDRLLVVVGPCSIHEPESALEYAGRLLAAAQPHKFPSISREGRAIVVTTTGNPHCHLVLRGGRDAPNYDAASVRAAADALESAGLPRRLMVDCSHGNSGNDHRRQSVVAAEAAAQIAAGSRDICGVMLESHLVEGRQNIEHGRNGLRYGQSVTDACLGWETTTRVLQELAEAVRQRRQSR
jgi:3-deoxy-D-arabino-heptulosonate 7-phosphate (DAHP) synthase